MSRTDDTVSGYLIGAYDYLKGKLGEKRFGPKFVKGVANAFVIFKGSKDKRNECTLCKTRTKIAFYEVMRMLVGTYLTEGDSIKQLENYVDGMRRGKVTLLRSRGAVEGSGGDGRRVHEEIDQEGRLAQEVAAVTPTPL